MRKRTHDAGQSILVVALSMVVILGCLGLAVDLGYMRYVKRQVQMLADAAAMAGARWVAASTASPTLDTVAKAALIENGITSPNSDTSCTPAPALSTTSYVVKNPPSCLGSTADPYNNNSGYVEVIVARNVPSPFGRILGIPSSVVSARAEAGLTVSVTQSLVLLGRSGTDLTMKGSDQIIAGGGVVSDGPVSCNGSTSIVSPSITIAAPSNGGCTGATVNGLPVSDPLAYMTPPCSGNGCGACTSVSGGASSLTPGTYCGFSNNGMSFAPGLYIIEGKLQPRGNWTGTGVTFFLTGTSAHNYGGLDAQSNATLGTPSTPFSAPNSGTYKTILFWQDPNAVGSSPLSDSSFKANDVCNCQGVFYFPTTGLTYSGGTGAAYTGIIAQTLYTNGSVNLPSDYSGVTGGSPFKVVAMSE